MAWKTRMLDDPEAVETVYSGSVSPDELLAAGRATLALGTKHACRFVLADCRELTGGHSIVDLYALASELSEATAPSRLVEAVLLPDSPLAEDHVRFWETLGVNRGLNVRLFRDREEALRWLRSEPAH